MKLGGGNSGGGGDGYGGDGGGGGAGTDRCELPNNWGVHPTTYQRREKR